MATVNIYNQDDEVEVVPVTLTGTDDAVVQVRSKGRFYIENSSGGDLTVNIVGAGATSVACPGVGNIDLTGGLDILVVNGTTKQIPVIPQYAEWLGDGNLTITGGTGATMYIVQA